MIKVLTIFGTRPEAIKMAPVVKALQNRAGIEQTVCVTAQHREMLDQVLDIFQIVPEVDLDLMKERQSLAGLTTRALSEVDRVISERRPDVVLVHGDTTTTAAAAMAAFYNKVPVGHVEAGLRTGDLQAPWPEEFNRRVADLVTKFYFAPTEGSKQNLLAEGIAPELVHVTGNTVIDALQEVVKIIGHDEALRARLDQEFTFLDPEKRLLLVTGHRRESFGGGFERICTALETLAERDDIEIVYPVHPNPNVREVVDAELGGRSNIKLIAPMDYVAFVHLMSRSHVVLTDSGGIQEEAPGLGKPVLVMRDTTERPEAMEAGTARLVGTDVDRIVGEVSTLFDDAVAYEAMSHAVNPYGNGTAAEQIVEVLLESGRSE